MPIDLSGKIALVTGATGELGRVMVRTLARAGADVAIHYHANQAKAEELAAECQELGRSAVVVQADITAKDDIEAMRDAVCTALGAPDIIVNNAVIQYSWTTVLEQAEADYEGQFRSSVMQNVLMAQAFVPAMKAKGWGRVIGINTECTMQCWPGQSAYTSGKAGMDRVLRVLAREIGADGITVNQIAPGWMLSENRTAEGTPQSYLDRVALGHRGDDQEIANAVVFLASDLAGFITGVYLPVCGGGVMPGI
ncbi:MAG: SDR family oxidoreductase [Victivallales bacterium]|nr:SDR family oxidoreductase [Victivallales bacterium]